METAFKKPDKPFAELFKGEKSGPIDKKVITLKTGDGGADFNKLMNSENGFRPSEEQLTKINKFTLSPKTADEVAVLPSLACNDLKDRDDDKFSTASVRAMVAMPQPYSFVGKGFMISHNHNVLPTGRIFDQKVVTAKIGETEGTDPVTFLQLFSYMPNTPQNKDYLENVDFGVYWAVSVGIQMGATECTVGDPHPFGTGWF